MSYNFPYEGIRQAFVTASGLPTTNVKWSQKGQPFVGQQWAPNQLTGFLELKVTTDLAVGKDDFRQGAALPSGDLEIEQVSRGTATITARITEYGSREALSTIREIRRRFGAPIVSEMLNTAGCSVKSNAKVLYEDKNIDDHVKSSAVFELQVNWVANADVTAEFGEGNWIETVQHTGTFEGE